jgi:hypothetical protein
MAEMNANDRMLLECIRGEFNNQPLAERFRVADFMDIEAVTELMRERAHALASVRRIEGRITTIMALIGRRRAERLRDAGTPTDAPTVNARSARQLPADQMEKKEF